MGVEEGPANRGAWLRRAQYAAGFLGSALVVFWVAAWLHGTVMSRRDLERFDEMREHRIEIARLDAPTEGDVTQPVDTSLWSPARVTGYQESLFQDLGTPLAVLRIRRLKIEVPVLPGTDDVSLNRGAGWIEGSAAPGTDGNCGIAGHRDGFFRGLKDLRIGDEIEVDTLNGSNTYVVDALTIVDPAEVSVLEPRDVPTVTLVTCYPFYFVGSAPQRFIVHAALRPIGRPPAAGTG
jgi:sortase A